MVYCFSSFFGFVPFVGRSLLVFAGFCFGAFLVLPIVLRRLSVLLVDPVAYIAKRLTQSICDLYLYRNILFDLGLIISSPRTFCLA